MDIFLQKDLYPRAYFCLQEAKKMKYTQSISQVHVVEHCFALYDRQQHSDMDVGRERSTWGEYLHSLTVRVSMIFNLPFFSCGLAHNTNAV